MSTLYNSAYASSINFDMSSPRCLGGSFPSSLLDRPLATYHSTAPSTNPSKRSVFSKIKRIATRSRSRSRSRVDAPSLQTAPSLMPPIPSGPHPKSLLSSRMYCQSFSTTDLDYIPYRPPASPPLSPSYSVCSQSTMSSMTSMTISSAATDPCSPSTPINSTFSAQQDTYCPWISYPEDPFSQYSVIQEERIQGRTSMDSPPKAITGIRTRTHSSPSVTHSRRPSTLASSQPLQMSPRLSISDLPVLSSRRGSYYAPRPDMNPTNQIAYEASSGDYAYYDSYFETDSTKDADLELERLRKECDDIRQMRQRKLALVGEVASDAHQTRHTRGRARDNVFNSEGLDGEWAFVGNVTSLTQTASHVIPGNRKRHSATNSTSISFLHETESRHRSYSDVSRSEGSMALRRPRVDVRGNVLCDGGEEEARKKERRRMRTRAPSSSLTPESSRSTISLVQQEVDHTLHMEKEHSTSTTPKQHPTTLHLDFPLPPPLVLPISMRLGPLSSTTPRSYLLPADKTHTHSPATKSLLEQSCSKIAIQSDMPARPIATDKGCPRGCKTSHATPLPKFSRDLAMPNVYSSASASLYSSSVVSLSSLSSCSTMQSNISLTHPSNSVLRQPSTSPVNLHSQPPPRFPPPSRPIPPVPSATVDVGSSPANERSSTIISSRPPVPLVPFSSSRLSTTYTSTNSIVTSTAQCRRMCEIKEGRELLQRGLMALSSAMPFATDEWEYEAVEDEAHNSTEQAPVEKSMEEATDLEIIAGYYSARSSFSLERL